MSKQNPKPDQESVKDRLLKFIDMEGISKSEFARKMNLSVAYLGAMRKSMPAEKIKQLVGIYPNLNRDWLLYGEGEMYRDANDDSTTPSVPADLEELSVPLLPVEAFAGSLQLYSEGVSLRDCEKVIAPMRGADFAIRIHGDSMEPRYYSGSLIFIKRINDRAFIPWGHPMVIDTENGVLVKVVQPSAEGPQFIEAQSYNQKYPPIQIPKESVFGLYRVLGQMDLAGTL